MAGSLTLIGTLMIVLGYLLGSIPTAVLVCHSMGIADPRQQGSRNPRAPPMCCASAPPPLRR